MPMPMLAEFALRLAGGLAALLLITPWRSVPPGFFRTQCQVILALAVLTALDLGRAGTDRTTLPVVVGLAVLGYLASIAWGLGLPRLGVPLTAGLVALAGGLLAWISRGPDPALWALNAAGRWGSAAALGSTLTAMLLGHYYLTSPAMSIEPLKRFVRAMAGSLAVRAVLAAVGLALWASGAVAPATSEPISALFLGMRWGLGIVAPAVATSMAWKTVAIRSTQSATGILYIGLTFLLFGEVTALTLSRVAGVIL
jgi:hypothetical protein